MFLMSEVPLYSKVRTRTVPWVVICSSRTSPTVELLAVGGLNSKYRCTSLIRTPPPVGPYSIPMPRDLW